MGTIRDAERPMEQICTGRKEIQWGGEHHFAEVISIELSADLGGDLPGYLLSVASMNAILEYFEAWKESQVTEEP